MDAPRDKRAWACLVHGVFLAVALVGLQYRRLLLVAGLGELTWPEAIALLLPEAAVALFFEAGWLAIATVGRPWAERAWRLGFANGHLLLYALALLDHRSFTVTGARSSSEVWRYVLDNAAMLNALLLELFTPRFLVLLAAVPLWMLLAALIAARPFFELRVRAGRLALLAVTVPWLVWLGGGRRPLAVSSTFVDALLLFPRVRYAAERMRPELARSGLYKAPEVEGLARRPNVLFLILESMRDDAFGGSRIQAELVSRGRRYTRTYASVIHTSKALVGLLCGMYPRLRMPISEARPGGLPLRCLPELLGEQGYRTLWAQSALGSFEERPGLVANMGFQHGIYGEELLAAGWEGYGYFGVDEHALLEPVEGWLASGEDPWLLALLTVTTHHPYVLPGGERPSEDEEPAAYAAAVAHVDGFLEELLGRLEAGGWLEDTVVVVVGDHGEAFGEHHRRYHNNVPYEETVRTPLVLLGPGITPGEDEGLRSHLDLLPTLLELTGARWEGELPGRSLLGPGHERVLTACWLTSYCLAEVAGQDKTIFHYGYADTEVFDLASDPGERRDLAGTLDPEELRAREDRMLGLQLGVELVYGGR